MNHYRSIPGLGPQKASASTTCQKCLKKGHYSYECKASLSERPYAARPSRSQVLRNPKLGKPLEMEGNVGLGEGIGQGSEGVADQVLAEQEARRRDEGQRRSRSPGDEDREERPRGRERSMSSVDSVETISTNRDDSRSPPRGSAQHSRSAGKTNGVDRSPSLSASPAPSVSRKRRRPSTSPFSQSPSPPPRSRHPENHREHRRRYRTNSPDDRGRPHSVRRGSRRSRSGSDGVSMDKSRITKQRRILEEDDEDEYAIRDGEYGGRERTSNATYHSARGERLRFGQRETLDHRGGEGDAWRDAQGEGRDEGVNGRAKGKERERERRKERRKERSLSPYSRRLALTQSMNLGR